MSAANPRGARGAVLLAATLAVAGALLLLATTGARLAMAAVLLLNLAAAVVMVGAVSRAVTKRADGFALSALNRYSLSRLQMGVWTVAVVAILLTISEWNLLAKASAETLAITVPGPLVAVLGISFGSAVAAPAILSLRAAATDQATDQQLSAAQERDVSSAGLVAQGQVVGRSNADQASWTDLFTGEEAATAGRVDLFKVQQALLTTVIVTVYLGSTLKLFAGAEPVTTMPPIGEGMAELLAISHAGYLAYKAAPKPDASRGTG